MPTIMFMIFLRESEENIAINFYPLDVDENQPPDLHIEWYSGPPGLNLQNCPDIRRIPGKRFNDVQFAMYALIANFYINDIEKDETRKMFSAICWLNVDWKGQFFLWGLSLFDFSENLEYLYKIVIIFRMWSW